MCILICAITEILYLQQPFIAASYLTSMAVVDSNFYRHMSIMSYIMALYNIGFAKSPTSIMIVQSQIINK